jgi:hypothetical protein
MRPARRGEFGTGMKWLMKSFPLLALLTLALLAREFAAVEIGSGDKMPFAYRINVIDKAGATTEQIELAKVAVESALREYGKYISGTGTIDVDVHLQPAATFHPGIDVNGRPSQATTIGNISRIDSVAASELITGIDPNGISSDATITINTDALSLYWFGDRSNVPADKVDGVSKIIASLSNAFNVFSNLDAATGQFRKTPIGTTFDDPLGHLVQRVSSDISPSGWVFVGINAIAVYGKPVPIGETFSTLLGLDFSALTSATFFGDDVFTSRNGVNATVGDYDTTRDHLQPGKAYGLSPLDLAIIKDLNPGLKVTIPQNGTAQNDTFRPLLGVADIYDGLTARDTVIEASARSSYNVTQNSDGSVSVSLKSNADDADTLTNVERVHFSDGVLIFDGGANASPAYRLYQAAFARVPDEGGLLVQAHQAFDVLVPQKVAAGFSATDKVAGFTISSAQYQAEIDVAGRFITSPEFIAKYGANVSDGQFVDLLYRNVLGRLPDAGGRAVQVDALQHGTTRATLLANFAESTENVALTATNTAVGLWSTFPDSAFG